MTTATHSVTPGRQRCRRVPVAWAALILFDLFLIAFAVTHSTSVATAQTQPPDDSWTVVQVDGPDRESDLQPRFEALDVFVDSGDHPLAAWQLELISDTPGIEIVGIEGGEHAAFQEPPYYDPRAMNHNRVILAAFDTGSELPIGRSRVARIHVQVTGTGVREYRTRITASATVDGERIPAAISVSKAGV